MQHDRNYYYNILGLNPGATPTEIKAAFRRLVKFYHPDRDGSHDAEMMYKEIHAAYKALIESPFAETDAGMNTAAGHHHPKRAAHNYSTQSSGKTRQPGADSQDSSKQPTWTS
ncbi:MAG: DnaJ domain-containing protein, partial [Synergistaceae bacterium]|nr:DnaJ domain-containing protein [Synergistaceae bacterium]